MNAWPVMQRELRAEARNKSNYWTRVYAGLLLVIMFAGVMFLAEEVSPSRLGGLLFGNLHTVIAVLIWLGAPLMTADCIARERRDGTLGLLFLTPLPPSGLAIGKSLIHGLRSLSLLLVAVPVMFLPVLLGGVTWKDGVLALILDLNGLMLALSAGLLASTLTSSWTRAVILAELFSLILLALFAGTCGVEFILQVLPLVPFRGVIETPPWPILLAAVVGCGLAGISNVAGVWREAWTHFPPSLQGELIWAAGRNLLLFVGFAACVVGLAGWRLRKLRLGESESPRQARVKRTFLAPRFALGFLRRRNRRLLDRNPIAWLQGYSTTARLAKWSWCLLAILATGLAPWFVALDGGTMYEADWLEWVLTVFAVLSAGLSFTSVGSFRRERETGALELLLVTPLSVGQIIRGRLQGVWLQFLPAVLVLLTAAVMTNRLEMFSRDNAPFLVVLVSTFLTMPMLGLLLSTLPGNWIAAWLATFLIGWVSPLAPEAGLWCVGTVIHLLQGHEFELNNDVVRRFSDFWNTTPGRQLLRSHVIPFVSQWLVAALAAGALYWRLKRRLFGAR